MTTDLELLDDRARAAGRALRERAAARPVPVLDLQAPVTPIRRVGRGLLLTAAAVVAVVAAVALSVVIDDAPDTGTVADLPVPDGVEPVLWQPRGSGVTMSVPSTWLAAREDGTPTPWARRAPDGEAFAFVHRTLSRPDSTAGDMAEWRRRGLEGLGATGVVESAAVVDGYAGRRFDYRFPNGDAEPVHDREYVVEAEDGTWVGIVLGETDPADEDEVLAWIASTIEVDPHALGDVYGAVEHPAAPLDPPAGVEASTFGPPRFPASVDVPAAWDTKPAAWLTHYMHGIEGPGGRVLMTTSATDMDDRASELARDGGRLAGEVLGVRIEGSEPVTVDGRPGRMLRYRLPGFDDFAEVAVVEYAVDLPDDTTLIVSIVNAGGLGTATLDWMRSTIRVAYPPA